jgi:lipopolysaccharide/colanic/teichoic acid biosynthesis glycosyltransferase
MSAPPETELALACPEPTLSTSGEPDSMGVADPALIQALATPIVGPHFTRQGWSVRLSAAAKRCLDVLVSAVLLLVLVPLVVVLAIAIKLDSRGPTFFRCERVGYRGRRLMMLKFRKMREGAAGGPLTLAGDARFTRIGALLARLKLDELPQLWHVLRGDMSLVGPRPECGRFVDCYPHEYERILATRPGLVGLSQLAFIDESRILDQKDPVGNYIEYILPQKVEMDLWYVQRRSLRLDLRILVWASVAVPLRLSVAVDRATGRMSLSRREVP